MIVVEHNRPSRPALKRGWLVMTPFLVAELSGTVSTTASVHLDNMSDTTTPPPSSDGQSEDSLDTQLEDAPKTIHSGQVRQIKPLSYIGLIRENGMYGQNALNAF
jgi:hypothetical protein